MMEIKSFDTISLGQEFCGVGGWCWWPVTKYRHQHDYIVTLNPGPCVVDTDMPKRY